MEQAPKYKVFNRDMMKYIAIFFMFWGHLFAWVNLMRDKDYDQTALPVWMQIVIHFSLFCPTVMFFFIADGYHYTRDRKKYAVRLAVFAVITQFSEWLVFQPVYGWWTGNVIADLFFGLVILCVWECDWKRWKRILLIIGLLGLNALCMSPWMIGGPIRILCLHCFRKKPKARLISYTLLVLLYCVLSAFGISPDAASPVMAYDNIAVEFAASMLAYLCMTVLYNGKKGRHPNFAKWFFYVFYPAHYLVIYCAEYLTR